MKKLSLLLVPMLFMACKKDDRREGVAGVYIGTYEYQALVDTIFTSGIDTFTVTVDADSDDKLVFSDKQNQSSFKATLDNDLSFTDGTQCGPRGSFKNDSLLYNWGCFNQPPYSGTSYKLKKQ